MATATITLFLRFGDPLRLRTAELSKWSGKAVAAPRTDLDQLLQRDEVSKSGIYILTSTDPDTGKVIRYIGEAEVIADRIRAHRAKDFWVQAYLFISKDENLTKGHIRYLEGRLIGEAQKAGRYGLANTVSSGAKLPESDREDMEVFLEKIALLLPVLGTDILSPMAVPVGGPSDRLSAKIKGLVGYGQRTPSGFVVFMKLPRFRGDPG